MNGDSALCYADFIDLGGNVSIAFNIVLHGLLIGTLGLFTVWLLIDTVREPEPRQRMKRMLALAAGALVTLGAQAAGLSYAEFTVGALAGARGSSAVANVGATLVPALLGVGLGFFLVGVAKNSNARAMRLVTFIGMLAATAFAQVYAEATATNGIELGTAALPNITFVTGVILTYVFAADEHERSEGEGMMKSVLRGFAQRKQEDAPAGLKGLLPTQSMGPKVKRQDPFAQKP